MTKLTSPLVVAGLPWAAKSMAAAGLALALIGCVTPPLSIRELSNAGTGRAGLYSTVVFGRILFVDENQQFAFKQETDTGCVVGATVLFILMIPLGVALGVGPPRGSPIDCTEEPPTIYFFHQESGRAGQVRAGLDGRFYATMPSGLYYISIKHDRLRTGTILQNVAFSIDSTTRNYIGTLSVNLSNNSINIIDESEVESDIANSRFPFFIKKENIEYRPMIYIDDSEITNTCGSFSRYKEGSAFHSCIRDALARIRDALARKQALHAKPVARTTVDKPPGHRWNGRWFGKDRRWRIYLEISNDTLVGRLMRPGGTVLDLTGTVELDGGIRGQIIGATGDSGGAVGGAMPNLWVSSVGSDEVALTVERMD